MSELASAAAKLERCVAAEAAARAALLAAEESAERARNAFAAEPTAELEEAVERAEREQRRARRFADVHAQARAGAERAHAQAVRAAAVVRLAQAKEARSALTGGVGRLLDDFAAVYDQLAELVTRAHDLAQLDVELVGNARAAAETAGVRFRGDPLSLSALRTAVGARLFEGWPCPELPASDRPVNEFKRAIGALDEPCTAPQKRTRLRQLIEAGVDLFGAEVGAWLTLAPPPSWGEGGLYAQRYEEAQRLLQAITGAEDDDTAAA